MNFVRMATVAAFGACLMATNAHAITFNFSAPIAFDNVTAVNFAGGNANNNLQLAAAFDFTAPVTNGPNGNTTGNPVTSDPLLATQLAYPAFLLSSDMGLSGKGGTIGVGGSNSFYFFNFESVNSGTGAVIGQVVGGFETATGSVVVNTSTETPQFPGRAADRRVQPNLWGTPRSATSTPRGRWMWISPAAACRPSARSARREHSLLAR